MPRDYDANRRRLNQRGDEAMDDARYAADSFRHALQPRGCVLTLVAVGAVVAVATAAARSMLA